MLELPYWLTKITGLPRGFTFPEALKNLIWTAGVTICTNLRDVIFNFRHLTIADNALAGL